MKNRVNRNLIWAVALLIGLSGCAGSKTTDSTGEYIDDASITTKVKAKMIADKQVSALDINVETFKGVVYLSGVADNQQEVDKADAIARGVPGVKSVKNDIHLKK